MRRYKELLQTSEEQESSYWAFIDFNNAPKGLNEAEQWLCQSFIESFAIGKRLIMRLTRRIWTQMFSPLSSTGVNPYTRILLNQSREQAGNGACK